MIAWSNALGQKSMAEMCSKGGFHPMEDRHQREGTKKPLNPHSSRPLTLVMPHLPEFPWHLKSTLPMKNPTFQPMEEHSMFKSYQTTDL